MKKLFLLAFLFAARAYAQTPGEWSDVQDYWVDASGGDAVIAGTVSSVGIDASGMTGVNVGNSPIVDSGNITLSWASQSANLGLLSPDNAAGTPTFRAVKPRDLGATAATGLCLKGSSATAMDWASCSGGTTVINDTIWDTKGDIVAATAADTAVKVPVGADFTYLQASSAATPGVAYVDPFLDTQTLRFFEDFCGITLGQFGTATGSGVVANEIAGTVAHPCERIMSVGAATGMEIYTAYNTTTATPGNLFLGGGVLTWKASFQVSSIGDGTDIIKYTAGFCDKTAANTECNYGVYFLFDRANSTTNWRIVDMNNGTGTHTIDCGAVDTTAFHTYQIIVNAADTSAQGYIDGVACTGGANTAHLPPNNAGGVVGMLKADKTSGSTTTFNMTLDYMLEVYHLTTTR